MGRETRRQPEKPLTDMDRTAIAKAREILRFYGLDAHPDTPEPLSELGYEQRMARGRALELAVQVCVAGNTKSDGAITSIAQEFYEWIWEGEHAQV